MTSSRRREGRTVSSSPMDVRRTVSEGSDLSIGLPCGLSAPRDFYRIPVLEDTRRFPHIARLDTPCMLRVIVTPAVYWSFVPLKRAFRYQHWAGFSGRTQPFDLAATYVLGKQSGLPGHCDQPLAWLAPLLPKVRGQFAEFPRVDFCRHALGFSPRGTCVSSRYGHSG